MPRKSSKVVKTFRFEGKRYSVSADTEKEAIVKAELKKQKLMEGRCIVSNSMTVEEWGNVCLFSYRSGASERTFKSYQNRAKNCVYKHIGSMKLKDVKPIHCQNCLNAQIGNSDYQIRQTKQLLKLFFSKAYENNLIGRDVSLNLYTPKGHSTERRNLSNAERQVFISTAKDRRYFASLLMYFCGARPSEARECIGSDIVNIKGENMLHIRGTKTKNADRYVPIPKEFYELIKDTEPDKPIAPNQDGRKMDEKAFQRQWKSLKREMNIAMGCKVYRNQLVKPYPLADDLVPYCLRHDFATRCAKKYDITVTKYLMGHSDISMTANVYTHIDEERIVELLRDDHRDDQ